VAQVGVGESPRHRHEGRHGDRLSSGRRRLPAALKTAGERRGMKRYGAHLSPPDTQVGAPPEAACREKYACRVCATTGGRVAARGPSARAPEVRANAVKCVCGRNQRHKNAASSPAVLRVVRSNEMRLSAYSRVRRALWDALWCVCAGSSGGSSSRCYPVRERRQRAAFLAAPSRARVRLELALQAAPPWH